MEGAATSLVEEKSAVLNDGCLIGANASAVMARAKRNVAVFIMVE